MKGKLGKKFYEKFWLGKVRETSFSVIRAMSRLKELWFYWLSTSGAQFRGS